MVKKRNEVDKIQLASRVMQALDMLYPTPNTLLIASNPWELMVATILAAQCTDKRVNTITPLLFEKYPSVESIAKANILELEEVIKPTGFYHNKGKNIIACAQALLAHHGGIVPRTMEELIKLPGIGRKTANCVLWGGFGINAGIAVDTHVKRIVNRLGLTNQEDPVAIEKEILPFFPQKDWGNVNHKMVWFGRDTCDARKPKCQDCIMSSFCQYNTQKALGVLS